ncbi:peptide/nickel transport system permease protein [Lentzea waywayandensis]|uniref:Peptide/nickel transport system permease protein n=2 Tax=Lentzea waywayandensis TaxID=84724 RepID=A0A1I6D404_9PSEU|nr:peptide/nickel transport system permease protein [Lentzea waywayandensis]
MMILIAINATYFFATLFLDPRSNYRDLRPTRSDEEIGDALALYGLDPRMPAVDRWWSWLSDVILRFDWGHSPTGVPVGSEIPHRALLSGQLILAGVVLSVILGVALGVYTASRQYGIADRVLQTLSVLLYNMPVVVSALGLILLAVWFNQKLGQTVLSVAGAGTPGGVAGGFWPVLLDRANHLVLPTINLTLLGSAGWHLTQRSLLLDNINADYVRTARATGLTRTQAIRRHALRSSTIPTATSIAFTIPAVFTGAVITESVFGWEGMGRYFIQTIIRNDVHGVVAVAAFGAAATAAGAIFADIATAILDPRVRVN